MTVQKHPIQLIIAGAQKAGTTSLKEYLGQHPAICTHEQREMTYFVRDEQYEQGYRQAWRRYFGCSQAEQVIVAKSVEVMYISQAMKRLKAHNANVQIVLSLRNPVDRAYSAYWYARRRGWENIESFEDAIHSDPARFNDEITRQSCAYLDRSRYIEHIFTLLEYFKREQLHIFLLEDLKRCPRRVLRTLFSLFENLDADFLPNLEREHNTASLPRSVLFAQFTSSPDTLPYAKRVIRRVLPGKWIYHIKNLLQRVNEYDFTPPPMNPETRVHLIEYFKPYNARLSTFLERDLSHWEDI